MIAADVRREQRLLGAGGAADRDPRDLAGAPDRGVVVAQPTGGWYKDAVIYEIHVRASSTGTEILQRATSGADREARSPPGAE